MSVFRRINWLSVFVFVFVCGCQNALLAQVTSYLPILQSTDTAELGLALSNPTLQEVPVTLTAFRYNGEVIRAAEMTNPVMIKIPAAGQRAFVAAELFGKGIAGQNGWVEIQSASAAVQGFFLLFDRKLTYVDGAELQTNPAGRLIFPIVSASPQSATTISFIHTGTQVLNLAAISFYNNDGQLLARSMLTLAPKTWFSGSVTTLLPDAAGTEGYVVLDSSVSPFSAAAPTLVGVETYRGRGDAAVLAAIPDTSTQRTGYLPHFVTQAGYASRLSLLNCTSQSQIVQITAAGLEAGGAAMNPSSITVTRTIPAHGRIVEDLDKGFGSSGDKLVTGYIRWDTETNTSGFVGYLDYGSTDGVLLSAVPIQTATYSDLLFSHVAEGAGYYTGIAFLNPDTQATAINVETFDQSGKAVGRTAFTLAAHQRRVGVCGSSYLQLRPRSAATFASALRGRFMPSRCSDPQGRSGSLLTLPDVG